MIAFDTDSFELAPMAPGLRVSFPVHSADRDSQHGDRPASSSIRVRPSPHTPTAPKSSWIILQGTAEARIGAEVGRLEKNQVGLVPPMAPHGLTNIGDDVLRVLGTFSASTVVSTFEVPFGEDGPQVVVIGSPSCWPAGSRSRWPHRAHRRGRSRSVPRLEGRDAMP